jgi:hypothetical protein
VVSDNTTIHLTPGGWAGGTWLRCGFCRRLELIYEADLTRPEQDAAIDALFDLAERAAHARRVYRQRRRRRW